MDIKKLIDGGAFVSVGLHFFICGLPLLLILFGSTIVPFKLPHNVMTIILIIAGLLLAASIVLELRGCGCKKSKAKVICLLVCIVLYAAGFAGHFGLFDKFV
jgi:hypothetical protein